MKKFLTLMISLVLCLSFGLMLVACNNNPDETNPPVTDGETGAPGDSDNNNPSSPEQPTEPANGNILVAYFSWSASGNTERMATYIAEQIGAFVYEIEPLVPYPTEYTPTTEVAAKEKEENARPEIKNPIDVSNYDHIFVGFPIWWYDLPMPVWTFLEEYDLSGKTIIPFFSHNGSSSGASSISTIKRLCPDSTVVNDYLSVRGSSVSSAESQVTSWINDLGIKTED